MTTPEPDRAKWEILEDWLFDHETVQFTVYELAASKGIQVWEASALINSYLSAQRTQGSTALYMLKRNGRTRSAVWSVGQRTADARALGQTLMDDVVVKVKRAYVPDLSHLAERNPRAARYAEAKIEAVTRGALVVLAGALDAVVMDGTDDE